MSPIGRRRFTQGLAANAAAFGLVGSLGLPVAAAPRPAYGGPKVIIVRFGGGVRRRETIVPAHSYSPFLIHGLAPRGVLFRDMRIDTREGVETGHGQGTLQILTGKYEAFRDVGDASFRERFEPSVPTLFEYLRKTFDLPTHQALLINGEDRPDEEYFTFGNHRLFGISYRSEVVSLFRFKTYLLRQKLAAGLDSEKELEEAAQKLAEHEAFDHRRVDRAGQAPEIEAFWARWRHHYGDSGLRNPRGDRLLTELAVRALRELRPRLVMINYQDPDYVHWGNASHYTRGIAAIDQGLQRLVEAVAADPEYRDDTVFMIVPDCGRDSNPLLALPYQHHFGSRSAHEIWALIFGPGIAKGLVVDRTVDQTSVAATLGQVMGLATPFAEGEVLAECFA